MSDEASRPDGLILMTWDELQNQETRCSEPTPMLRMRGKRNDPGGAWTEQQYRISVYRGGKLVAAEMEWRRLPLVLED